MNERDEPMDLDSPTPAERLLGRFRPVGPPPELRQRVLGLASLAGQERHRGRWALWLWRAAVAAGFLVAVGLNLSAERISQRIAARVGAGPVVWTPQAEEAAELLDGQGAGRRYLAMVLRAGPLQPQVTAVPGDDGHIPSR